MHELMMIVIIGAPILFSEIGFCMASCSYILYIIMYVYVRVASRNRTLAHIRRFEKMADEVDATENRLYWFT